MDWVYFVVSEMAPFFPGSVKGVEVCSFDVAHGCSDGQSVHFVCVDSILFPHNHFEQHKRTWAGIWNFKNICIVKKKKNYLEQ